MTLAAQFTYKNNDSVFMLGDGLISSDEEPLGNFIMPGSGKVGRPKSRHGYLVGIEQKLNILGSDLAFVWSGRQDLAYQFATKLFEKYDDPSYDFDSLKPFLESWPESLSEEDRGQIKLIVTAHVDGEYRTWRWGIKPIKGYKHFDSLLIAGTGTKSFLDMIGEESDNVDTDDQATGHAMNILNKLYHDDLFIKSTYSEAFGGFYELASCSQSGIEKLSDVLITTLHIDAAQLDRGFAIPLTFLKYDVLGKLVVLRETKAKGDEKAPNFENVGHLYLPVVPAHREEAIKSMKKLRAEGGFWDSELIGDMKARHTLIMLRLVDGKHELRIPLYYRKPNRNTPLSVSLEDGKVSLFLAQELLDAISSVIEKHVDQNAGRLKGDDQL